jgi:hypothetical protein
MTETIFRENENYQSWWALWFWSFGVDEEVIQSFGRSVDNETRYTEDFSMIFVPFCGGAWLEATTFFLVNPFYHAFHGISACQSASC